MVDFPVLITRADLFEALDEAEAAELKDVAVSRLPPETAQMVKSLAHSLGHGLELIDDVIKTNILPFDLAGEPHMGLFLYNSVSSPPPSFFYVRKWMDFPAEKTAVFFLPLLTRQQQRMNHNCKPKYTPIFYRRTPS